MVEVEVEVPRGCPGFHYISENQGRGRPENQVRRRSGKVKRMAVGSVGGRGFVGYCVFSSRGVGARRKLRNESKATVATPPGEKLLAHFSGTFLLVVRPLRYLPR